MTAVINAFGQPIGNTWKDITPDESAAGVTIANGDLDELDPHRYSNTLDHAAVQAAVNVAAQRAGGGRVPIREDFTFTDPVELARNVFLEWWGGSIECVACEAVEWNFAAADGQHGIIGALPIHGTGCTSVWALDQFTEDSDHECYGLYIDGPQITGDFLGGIRCRTTRNSHIKNVWIVCTNGVDLAGKNIVCRFDNNEVVGGGTGSIGLNLDFATFTNGGSHQVRPEGIYGGGNQIYGHDYPLNILAVTSLELVVDLVGKVNCIRYSTVSGICDVRGYYEIISATATACVKGVAQAQVGRSGNIKISGYCIASNLAVCGGLDIAANTTDTDIDLSFDGFSTYDILIVGSGNINIKRGTKCRSIGNATSIRIEDTLPGRPITIEDGVYCAGRVWVPFSSPSKGQVLVGAMTGAYSTYVRGVSVITNPATSVTTTFASLLGSTTQTGNTNGTSGVISALADTTAYDLGQRVFVSNGFATTGPFRILSKTASTITVDGTSDTAETGVDVSIQNIPNFAAAADTDLELDLIIGAPSVDVDGVFGTAAVDGVTINVNTTPASSVTIPWEVRSRMRYS